LHVNGYRELQKALRDADKDTRKESRVAFKAVAESVRRDAASLLTSEDPRHAKSAAGYRVYVRQRGIGVEQALRKTTGKHPEFGKFQMRHALVPAADDNKDTVRREMEHALHTVADRFNHKGI
jgi:uncharacterized membrane protein